MKGMYGEATGGSTHRMWLEAATIHKKVYGREGNFRKCRAWDAGSGLGKIIMHFVSMFEESQGAIGVEFNEARVALFMAVLRRIFANVEGVEAIPGFNTVCGDLFELETLGDLFQVWFMFDSAFEPELMEYIGKLWNNSSGEMLICFRTPEYLEDLGYEDLEHHVRFMGRLIVFPNILTNPFVLN
jgi:hypothetical protein